MMTTNIFPLLGAIFVLLIGLFVLLKDRNSSVNKLFFGFCVVVFFWLFGTFMMFLNRGDDALAIFWDRFVYIGVVFMPTLMHHFSLVFTPPKNNQQKKLLYFNYAISIIFLLLSRTDYFVADLFKYQWGVHTKAQIGHHIFILWFYFASALMFVNFYKFYKNIADAVQKTQIKYATVAFLSIILIGGTAYLPAYGIAVYPFSYLSGVFFAICLGYAILRYNFLDIKVFIRKNVFYFLTGLLLFGIYALVLWLIKYLSSWNGLPQLSLNSGGFNLFTATGLVIALACFPLCLFILRNILASGERVKEKVLVILFTLAVGIWGLGGVFISLEQNPATSLLLWRLTHIGVIMIPVFLLHFAIVFLEKNKFFHKLLVAGSYLFGLILLVANWFGVFIRNVRPVFGHFYYDSPPTILYIIFFSYFVAAVLLVHYWLIKEFARAVDLRKKQIQYILLGTGLGFAGGTLSFLPVFNLDIYPVLNFSAAFFPIFTAVGVLRYKLMDIKVFIRKSVFYLLLGFLLLGFYWLAVWSLRYLNDGQKFFYQSNIDWTQIKLWYFPISAAINAVVTIVFGLFVLLKNYHSRLARWFFALCVSIFVWSAGYFFWQTSGDAISALFWSRALMLGAIFTALFFLHWVIIFLDLEKKFTYLLVLFYANAIFWVAISFSSYFISGVEPRMFFKFWPMPGLLYGVYLFLWLVQVVIASVLLFKKYFTSANREEKNQVGITLIGLVMAFLGGATNYLLWYNIPVAPWGNILVVFMPISLGYAILRYKFFNITLFIRKWLFYLFLGLAIVLVYTFSASFLQILNINNSVAQYGFAGLVAVLVSVFLFPRLEKFLLENKLFFKNNYDYADALGESSKIIGQSIDFEKITNDNFNILKKLFSLERAIYVLFDTNGESGRVIGLQAYGFMFSLDDVLAEYRERIVNFFSWRRQIVFSSLLPREIMALPAGVEKEKLISALALLRQLSLAALLPVYSKDKLIGLVALGEKSGGEPYNSQDEEFLEALAAQLSMALENIKSYQKLKNYSADLKQEVLAATRELQELNNKQSRFLADISHELQSPLSILRGNFGLLSQASCEPGLLDRSQGSLERLSRLVNNLMLLAKSDFGQLEIKKEPNNLRQLLQEVYDETFVLADDKKITYELLADDQPLEILLDWEKMKSVFLNILSNAFKYVTPGGNIKVTLDQTAAGARLTFFNSGEAIPVEDLLHLFERFYRRETDKEEGKKGTGLGLSITKTIVEGHGGRVWAENVPSGGVMFTVELENI